MFPYLACKFEKETLSNLVRECFGSDFPNILSKRQVVYIFNYLSELGAKSIILESHYVDKDYLEDYSSYYVKCFNDYGSRCGRLHFFSSEVDHSKVDSVLDSYDEGEVKKLQSSYLGFVVVKPLPETFIGKTCLRLYSAFLEEASRSVLKRMYNVNFFGIKLKVESVAFQEQDRVLSACATTSIWSALHSIEWNDVRNVSSCGKITSSAVNHISNSSNRFPNNGLTNKQILRALDVEGLKYHECNVVSLKEEGFFETVKCYVDSGLPLILGARIYDISSQEKAVEIGGHAVTVLGYKDLGDQSAIYIHDDRIGPFARAAFKETREFCSDDSGIDQAWCLVLQEKDDDSEWKEPHQILVAESLIAISHHKTRIPEIYARNTCEFVVAGYQHKIKKLSSADSGASAFADKVDYSVNMEQVSDLKARVLKSDAKNKKEVLLKSLARFLWVASIRFDGEVVFDIVFDATDIPQGDAVVAIINYDKGKFDLVTGGLDKFRAFDSPNERFSGKHFWRSFLSCIKPPGQSYEAYLDEQYGELRAPITLTKAEVERYSDSQGDRYEFYGETDEHLDDINEKLGGGQLIWAISSSGSILVGVETIEDGEKLGHPSITGLKAARIAGEINLEKDKWFINSKSGRYSGDYDEPNVLLEKALQKFKEVFYKQRESIEAKYYTP